MQVFKALWSILLCGSVVADRMEDFISRLDPDQNMHLKKIVKLVEPQNVTIIGSENIYQENGELVEIRTLELHWPQYNFQIQSDIANLVNMAEPEVNNAQFINFDENGQVSKEVFIGNDIKYAISDSVKTIYKTIHLESIDVLEEEIKKLEISEGHLSVLRYDEENRYISEGSNIVPEYLASVVSEVGETTQYILDEILKGLTRAYAEHKYDEAAIPGKLAYYLQKQFRRRDFYVFSGEPSGSYFKDDDDGFFEVTVQIDVIDSQIYTVFSNKKS